MALKIIGKIELPVDKKKERKEAKRGELKYYDTTTEYWQLGALRKQLYVAYNGICCYCGCKTKLGEYVEGRGQEDDEATIEHVYTRTDIRRLVSNEVKLSCYRCNIDKGNAENREHKMKNYPSKATIQLIEHVQLSRWQKIRKWWRSIKRKI